MTKKIAKKNKKFDKSTPEQKRVLIAKDVLKAIKEDTITPTHGTWVSRYLGHNVKNPDSYDEALVPGAYNPEDQFKNLVKDINCKVCGVGALFVCGVRRFNNLKINEVVNVPSYHLYDDDILPFLKRYFTKSQLRLIEIAFERGKSYEAITGKECVAKEMFDMETNANDRMNVIMKNIIKNKGTFIPVAATKV